VGHEYPVDSDQPGDDKGLAQIFAPAAFIFGGSVCGFEGDRGSRHLFLSSETFRSLKNVVFAYVRGGFSLSSCAPRGHNGGGF